MNAKELAQLLTAAADVLAEVVPRDDDDAVTAIGLLYLTADVFAAELDGADIFADSVWWLLEAG